MDKCIKGGGVRFQAGQQEKGGAGGSPKKDSGRNAIFCTIDGKQCVCAGKRVHGKITG